VVDATGLFEILEIRSTRVFGTVCLARRRADPLGRPVAVKVLSGTLAQNPRILSRARDEARLLSHLQHPNIVRVEELLSIDRRPVVVMEAIEGLSLRELVERRGGAALNAEVALEAARRTARALEDAYCGAASDDRRPLRLVHRDIKPGNILLTVHGEVKVVDFELARGEIADRETTTVSTVVGTAGYMAPERFGPSPEGPEVDVYSLGVTLIEVLSGREPALPLEADMHQTMLGEVVDELALVGLEGSHLEQVKDLLARMCAYEPLDRPTPGEVREEIRAIQKRADLPSDLHRFAEQVVAPLWQTRPVGPPREHPTWADVSFLERVPADETISVEPEAREAAPENVADQRVHEFLGREGWEEHKRELKWLLTLEPEWTPEPFLELLHRHARRPWWRFWARGPSDAQVAVALELLKLRATADVMEWARYYVGHHDERITRAAAVLLAQAGKEG
jgi:serine/threonine protein kinase